MSEVITGRVLISFRKREQRFLVKEPADDRDARRSPFGRDPVRKNHTGVSGKVGQQEVVSLERRSHVEIDLAHDLFHFLYDQIPDPVRLDIFHRGYEPGGPEDIRPGVFDLPHQKILFPAPGELVEGGSRLGTQDDGAIVHRVLRQAYRAGFGSQRPHDCKGRVVVRLVLLYAVEVAFQIADAKIPEIDPRTVVKRRVVERLVAVVGPVDGVKNERAILYSPADRKSTRLNSSHIPL